MHFGNKNQFLLYKTMVFLHPHCSHQKDNIKSLRVSKLLKIMPSYRFFLLCTKLNSWRIERNMVKTASFALWQLCLWKYIIDDTCIILIFKRNLLLIIPKYIWYKFKWDIYINSFRTYIIQCVFYPYSFKFCNPRIMVQLCTWQLLCLSQRSRSVKITQEQIDHVQVTFLIQKKLRPGSISGDITCMKNSGNHPHKH